MNEEKEEFRDIKGFEGLYKISNKGNVYSVVNDKLMTISISANTYYKVTLFKDGKRYNENIHRLVAEAFIPNPNNYLIINHKDENRLNNNVENLEWCTYKYNNTYGTSREKYRESIKKFYETDKGKELKERYREMRKGSKQSEETINKRRESLIKSVSKLSYDERRAKYYDEKSAKEHSEFMKKRMQSLTEQERKDLYGRKLNVIEMLNMMYCRDYLMKFTDQKYITPFDMNEGEVLDDEYCSFIDYVFPKIK